jgi:hypothetical protein
MNFETVELTCENEVLYLSDGGPPFESCFSLREKSSKQYWSLCLLSHFLLSSLSFTFFIFVGILRLSVQHRAGV